jgi:hypothetical protein
MTRLPVSAALAALILVTHLTAQSGTITGKVLVRERENGDHSLLLDVESPNQVNRVEFNLPQRYTFVPGFLPRDWKLAQDGRDVTLTGDQVYRLNIRLDAKPDESLLRNLQGRSLDLQLGTAGTRATRTFKTKVGVLPRVRFRDDWSALVAHTFPPEVTPGSPVLGSAAEGYTDGIWIPGGNGGSSLQRAEEEMKRAEAMANDIARSGSKPQRIFNWTAIYDEIVDFERQTPKPAPRVFFYYDRWMEPQFGVTPPITLVPPANCTPTVSGGTPMVIAGKDACMQGCFGNKLSDLEKAAAFLLDGTRPVEPQAASPTTVVVRIPADVTPGEHTLTFSGVPGQLTLRILQVQGTIDKDRLWKGQSTTMRLQILGSDQPIPLKIFNRTPATIQVEGGDAQTIPTSGGPVNVVTRSVKGIMKGDFTIDFSVDQPACGSGR